jgi:outer membrane protein
VKGRALVLAAGLGSFLPATSRGQEATDLTGPLSLKQARDYALAHHAEVLAADLQAGAALQGVREARAGFYPQVAANFTAVAAGDSTRIAAPGGLNNPSVFQRESNGLLVSQLITDFGRTSDLTASFRYQAESAGQLAREVRARVLVGVDQAFFGVLGAEALLQVAEQTVKARALLVDKVKALAQASLKSGLDVSFAEVSLGEATLLKLRAQDRLDAARARLVAAMGLRQPLPLMPAEEPPSPPPPDDVDGLIRDALAGRPELLAFRAEREAAEKLAAAEKAARYPTISALGAVGFSPYRDDRLQETYATAGVNLAVPVFTGGRLSARAQGAELRANAIAQGLSDEETRLERDVRIAWLDARTAYKAIDVTKALLQSASQALDLAESRYGLGISSIVELSQAQLQKTEAEIANANARYDYQVKRSILDFQVGALP